MQGTSRRLPFADILAQSHDDPEPSSSASQMMRTTHQDEEMVPQGGPIAPSRNSGLSYTPASRSTPHVSSRASAKERDQVRNPGRRQAARSRIACSLLLSAGAIIALVCGTLPVGAILAPGDDPDPLNDASAPVLSASASAPVATMPEGMVHAESIPPPHDTQHSTAQVLEPVQHVLPSPPANEPPPPPTSTIPMEAQSITVLPSPEFSPPPVSAFSHSQSLVASISEPAQVVFTEPEVTSSTPEAPAPSSTEAPAPTPAPAEEVVITSTTATSSGTPASTSFDATPSAEPEPAAETTQATAEETIATTTEPPVTPSDPPSPSVAEAAPMSAEQASTDSVSSAPAVPNSRPAVGNPGPLLAQLKHRWNFASMDCAAVVHRTNPGAKFATSILSEKKDRYMLSPCPADGKNGNGQFVIVELCDDIMIDTVVLGNYEFFSRQFKRFRLRAAAKLHAREEDWYDFGTFRARNSRGLQVFQVEPRGDEGAHGAEGEMIPSYDGEEGGSGTGSSDGHGDQPPEPASAIPPSSGRKDARFFRYVRIDFLEHYGSEYYCPVSVLRIYGLTALDEFYQDQEEGGDGGASAAVAAAANPIVANVVELADQLDFAYQYAANGWGHIPSERNAPDEHRLIGDGTKEVEGQSNGAGSQHRSPPGGFGSHFDVMENMLDAAVAAVQSSSSASNSKSATLDTSGQWKKEAAASLASAQAAAASSAAAAVHATEEVETYRIDVDAGQPHVHVNIPGAGSALGADPVVLEEDKLTCGPDDLQNGSSETLASPPTPGSPGGSNGASSSGSETAPQPRSSIQPDVPPVTSTQQAGQHDAASTAAQPAAAAMPAQGSVVDAQHVVPVNMSSEGVAEALLNATAATNALPSANMQAPVVGSKGTVEVNATSLASASASSNVPVGQAGQQPALASPGGAPGKAANASVGTGAGSSPNATTTRSAASNASATASGAHGEIHRPPSPSHGSGGGAGSESIYRAINKRLAALEYNSTLNLAFIEHSQRLLRDSFMRMAERHQGRIDDMVRALNASNWRQFDMLRRRTQVDLQRSLFEADIRRQQADSERSAMVAQIHLLTEEVLMQKKISLAQLFLILGLFIFVALTRGMRAPQFIHTGLGSKVGLSSRPSTPIAISTTGSPNLDAPPTGSMSMFPTPSFIRQRLNRSRRVSAPTSSATGSRHASNPGLAHQPADRSRLSIVVPAGSQSSSVYRLNSGGSSPNGSILELNEVVPHQQQHHQPVRGEHWRERIRSNGTGSIVSFLDEEYDEEEVEEEEALSDSRRRSSSSVALQARRRSSSSTTTRSARSSSIRSGSDGKSMTGSLRGGNPRGATSTPPPPPPIQKDAVFALSVSDDSDLTAIIRSSSGTNDNDVTLEVEPGVGAHDESADTASDLKLKRKLSSVHPEKNKPGKRAGAFSFTFSSPASK
ncbi:hypothetical protein CF327_g3152 [Tilletia walkeri]|uniref:SUN domain-containing protein n=1 Tax=Tilletia walkeri TaxID=117179 RepID=A0A8X7N916_9BASI|nr:hypothetical protein CF327_g3152 [Tilletia walkeri]KAE8269476.1 hypothetical protein A4X09_0g2875 [Tilletia walkeri]